MKGNNVFFIKKNFQILRPAHTYVQARKVDILHICLHIELDSSDKQEKRLPHLFLKGGSWGEGGLRVERGARLLAQTTLDYPIAIASRLEGGRGGGGSFRLIRLTITRSFQTKDPVQIDRRPCPPSA